MKKSYKVYLDDEELKALKIKAEQMDLPIRAWLTRLLEKISKEDLIFIDENIKKTLRLLNLK